MSRNSLNLIDLVKGYLGGDFTNRMSSLLGERPDRTRSGINAAVPGLLSAFDDAASTPDGARRLSSAVDDADDSMLGNIGGMFGAGSGSWINRGSGMLGSLLGVGTLSGLTGNIGRSSGLSGRSVTMLLGFLGLLTLGALKREKQTRGLDSTGLSSLLASQRSNISDAAPEGTFKTAGESIEPDYGREPLRDVTETDRRSRDTGRYEETYRPGTREPARRSRLGWLLPLALLLIGLGLIWHYASRPTSSTVEAGREETGGLAQVTKLKDQLISTQTAAYGILRSIKDPASADAAAPKIQALNSTLDQMHNTYESLPSGSKSAVNSFMPSATARLRTEVDRVLNIPGVSDRIGSQMREMLTKFQSFS
jgi:Bacterial protein of unknown function (DUF937)